MKKSLIMLMLLTGIIQELFAQQLPSDKTFQVPDNIIMTRYFEVKLDKGNRFTLELSALADLERVANADSLITLFLADLEPLKDSLYNPLSNKRIDHVTDVAARKKIRFRQFNESASSFVVQEGELASLRIAQDTIHLIGIIPNPAPAGESNISRTNPRYYHFTFYLNDLSDLQHYRNGIINEKLQFIQKNYSSKWIYIKGTGRHYLKADPEVTAEKPRGVTRFAAGNGSYITFLFSVNAQNYKNYFVPSFSLGTRLTLSNPERTFKYEPELTSEMHYFFSKDSSGKLRTYQNNFLTLKYAQGGTKDRDPKKEFSFSAVFSLGYLVKRQGDFYEKNTFRMGAGRIQLKKTAIEPIFYFNGFFKKATPGIIITQYF